MEHQEEEQHASGGSIQKGRPAGSKNKIKVNPKPRKPYTSTKRTKCVAKEDLLERLKREVTEQALAVIPCEHFERWLASYAAHEGNDYVRKDQHEHTYNSTHHRVVTYGCNHTETRPKSLSEDQDSGSTNITLMNSMLQEGESGDSETQYEVIGCEAILDIYYFYETKQYQVIQLGVHDHEPTHVPQDLFALTGLPPLTSIPQELQHS